MRNSSRVAVLAIAMVLAACGSPSKDGAETDEGSDDTSSGEQQDAAPAGPTTTDAESASPTGSDLTDGSIASESTAPGTTGPGSSTIAGQSATESTRGGSSPGRSTTSSPTEGSGDGGGDDGSPTTPTTGVRSTTSTGLRAQTIRFAPPQTPWAFDEERTLQASATSSLALSFSASGACTVTDPIAGTVKATDVGRCDLTVSQPGGDGWARAEPMSHSVTISKAQPVVTFVDVTVQYLQEPFSFVLDATSTSAVAPTYEVTVDENGACSLYNSVALAVEITDGGLPKTCEVRASFIATNHYEFVTDTASVKITPTEVRIVSVSVVATEDGGADATVTLNRDWGIELANETCIVTGSLSVAQEYALHLDRRPCSATVNILFRDATHTLDSAPISFP